MLKDLGGLSSTVAVICHQVTDDVIAENYMFPVETIEIFAVIFPTKLNYESIVDRGGSKSPSLLKMTPQEISEAAPRPVL